MKTPILIRMPVELKELLTAQAKKLGVSTTALILNILWEQSKKVTKGV